MSIDTLREHLVWLDTSEPWTPEAMAEELDQPPALVVLDGIAAACSLHAWPVNESDGVGAYRRTLVAPATRTGAAVLSLGHPPKDRTRQTERHGYGATGWLDLVDGVGFRMEAGKTPIQRHARGSARLYAVKDRAGGVTMHGTLNGAREAGWWHLGTFIVDDTGTTVLYDQRAVRRTVAELLAPAEEQNQVQTGDALDELGRAVIRHLEQHGGTYESSRQLRDQLRAAGVKFRTEDIGPALERLEQAGKLEQDPYKPNRPRPGRLVSGSGKGGNHS